MKPGHEGEPESEPGRFRDYLNIKTQNTQNLFCGVEYFAPVRGWFFYLSSLSVLLCQVFFDGAVQFLITVISFLIAQSNLLSGLQAFLKGCKEFQ